MKLPGNFMTMKMRTPRTIRKKRMLRRRGFHVNEVRQTHCSKCAGAGTGGEKRAGEFCVMIYPKVAQDMIMNRCETVFYFSF